MKRLGNILGSLKLSFFLLVLLVLLIFERAVISQNALIPEEAKSSSWFLSLLDTIGFDSAASLDTPFRIVLVVFVVNLILSIKRMVKAKKQKQRRLQKFKKKSSISSLKSHCVFTTSIYPVKTITAFFQKHGLKVNVDESEAETCLIARKNDAGQWGVFFFHLTFIIVFAGAIVSFLSRSTGTVQLAEGDSFVEKYAHYSSISPRPLLYGGDREFLLLLDSIDFSYWRPGEIKERASTFTAFDSNGNTLGQYRVAVNHPFTIDGVSIYQGGSHGFLADLEVRDSSGAELAGISYFPVPVTTDGTMSDTINPPGTGLSFYLELFTGKVAEIEGLESLALRHDATLLKVTSIENGRKVFHGAVFEGGTIQVLDLQLGFKRLKPFTSFVLIRDRGVPIIFCGFVFLLAGLVVTYFWVPRRYWVHIRTAVDGYEVAVGGSTDKYKESFKVEFDEQMRQLQREISRS